MTQNRTRGCKALRLCYGRYQRFQFDLPIFFVSNNRDLNEEDETKLVNLPVVFHPLDKLRKQNKFLVQMYGERVRPTVDTVLRQLAIVECCHPGFELDVIRFVVPFEEKTIETAKCIFLNEGGNILGQLCSLMATNEATESEDQYVNWRNHEYYDEYEKSTLALFHTKIDIDLTYATNQLCYSEMEKVTELEGEAAGEKTWGKPEDMVFSARANQEADDLKSKAILQTTTASTATMTLFSNMGVSTSRDKANNNSFVSFHLVSQPPLNHREFVTGERLKKLLETCAGMASENLTSHGLCGYPYTIASYTRDAQWNENSYRWDEDSTLPPDAIQHRLPFEAEIPENFMDNAHNWVKTCTRRDAQETVVYGPQFCLNNQSAHIEELFKVLLGFEWNEVAVVHTDASMNWKDCEHVKPQVLAWLLIRLVDAEYNGFRSSHDWMKLAWRLRSSHSNCATSVTIPRPNRVNNLIYHCMVLTQATSRFRIAFLEGLNRVVATKHILVGLLPEDCFGPPDETQKRITTGFSYEVVGASNPRVEIVNFAFDTLSDKSDLKFIMAYGEHIQNLAQTLTRTNIVTFLLKWFASIEKHREEAEDENQNAQDEMTWPELLTKVKRRNPGKNFYKVHTFKDFALLFPDKAITFIQSEIVREKNDDSKFLRDYITNFAPVSWTTGPSAKKDKDILFASRDPDFVPLQAPKSGDSWSDKAKYLCTNLRYMSMDGYITRSANIWAPEIVDLVMAMSYGLYYVPVLAREVTGQLSKLVMEGGVKPTFDWKENHIEYFMNPASDSLSDKQSKLTQESFQSNEEWWIPQTKIQVR
jgi:hypothetical protein